MSPVIQIRKSPECVRPRAQNVGLRWTRSMFQPFRPTERFYARGRAHSVEVLPPP